MSDWRQETEALGFTWRPDCSRCRGAGEYRYVYEHDYHWTTCDCIGPEHFEQAASCGAQDVDANGRSVAGAIEPGFCGWCGWSKSCPTCVRGEREEGK